MKPEVLRDVPLGLDRQALLERLRILPGSDDARAFGALLDAALEVARPKAVYKESYVEARGDETVTVDGVTFTSRALRANLEGVHRVFPYVATCGREVDAAGRGLEDFLQQYWLDTIKADLLGASLRRLGGHLERRFGLGRTSTMSPGAGDVAVWPIEEQGRLFSLFGDVEDLIGVELTDSFLMIPIKSVSGIRFPTEIEFQSCQLCRREGCPSRRAAFDPALWKSVQGGSESGA
ncbi:MAG: vitamin B12 dependent methionine synthase [Phycisphaerae bacterium]